MNLELLNREIENEAVLVIMQFKGKPCVVTKIEPGGPDHSMRIVYTPLFVTPTIDGGYDVTHIALDKLHESIAVYARQPLALL